MFEEQSAIITQVIVERPSDRFAHLPSIFLVGPMGAGKTTIGKLLAKHLGRIFIDSDWHISQQAGADIPWIFAKEGESGFRERETKSLQELSKLPQAVIATGGGAVIREENRQLLDGGLVIYLNADVDTQLARTKKDPNRPLLQTANPRETLERLYQERSPLYLQVADIVITTGRAYPKQMLSEILDALRQYDLSHLSNHPNAITL